MDPKHDDSPEPVVVSRTTIPVEKTHQLSTPARPKPKLKTIVVQPVLTPQHVAVVASDDTPPYEGVINQMTKWMAGRDYAVYNLDGSLAQAEDILTQIASRNTTAIVAVGLRAALLMSEQSNKPVIFCQVFNYQSNELVRDRVKGVAAIVPLGDQLDLWSKANPSLQSVGAILGQGHETLIEEAQLESAARDIEFHHRTASSDKEALYLFKRLAPDIDGFWLFPDNRILSRTVIEKILTYSLRHRIQVTVFTPTLLRHGAFMSAASSDTDIAFRVLSILDQLNIARFDRVPPITPLSEIKITWSKRGLPSRVTSTTGAQ